jgi:ATP-dependent Clp protease protease subunit
MSFWNFVKNEATPDDIELRIEGEIVSDDDTWFYEWLEIPHANPNAFREQLKEHSGKNITLWVDSWGGDVFAAAGIYNALKEHKGKVTTKIDGKAVSAGSVIAMAGETVKMSPAGILMVHNPAGYMGWGEAKEMRHNADVLDQVKETIINVYQIKTKRSRAKLSEMMNNETWMSAKSAKAEGFIDEILYSDSSAEVGIENSYMMNRLAIANSADNAMKQFFEIYKAQHKPIEELRQVPVDLYQKLITNNERRSQL